MKRRASVWTAVLFIAVMGVAQAQEQKDERIEKRFTHKKGQTIAVDNVFGAVTVTGHDKNTVEVIIHRRTTARNADMLARAESQVVMDVTEESDLLELYVDGPFRHHEGQRRQGSRYRERDYKVIMDFELRVPREAAIQIHAVMDGDISIKDVKGDFDVHHVNGSIAMEGLAGSGEAYSVNGDVRLDFDSNPQGDCRFGALNGEVRMRFQKNLDADFELKTFNGEFFTDFELSMLPDKIFKEVERNGKTVYKADHLTAVRAGRGGPVIRLDGFNGDMFILDKELG